jgi:hypothetical protein
MYRLDNNYRETYIYESLDFPSHPFPCKQSFGFLHSTQCTYGSTTLLQRYEKNGFYKWKKASQCYKGMRDGFSLCYIAHGFNLYADLG